MIKLLFLTIYIMSFSFCERGDLVSSFFIDSKSPIEIQDYLDSSIGDFGLSASYGAKMFSIVYETVDQFGDIAIASGMLVIPDDSTHAFPLTSFQHGTQVRRESAPSMNGFNTLSQVMASSGFIYMEPDYLGLGQSDIFHPYHLKDVSAFTVIDMLRAAKHFCNQNNFIQFNEQLFLEGYSEGGYVTMAAVKEIEENLSDEFNITMSFPMAGAYDLSGVMVDLMLSEEVYPDPYYLPYFILTYIEKYELGEIEDFFKSEYANILPELFNGNHSGGYINSHLPSIPIQMMTDEMVNDFTNNPDFPFRLALQENDLYDWTPQSTMYLFHGIIDESVPYQNSVVAYNKFVQNGSESVFFETLEESYGGHAEAAPYCLLGAYNIISTVHMINDLGDLNQDSELNILDIVELSNLITSNGFISNYQNWAGDSNQDSSLNVLDIIKILNTILN